MNNIKKFIPPILVNTYEKLKTGKGKYQIGEYEINIPPNFALPDYQKIFKLYDRFLPVLAKNLPPNKTIIDVGANIGDTLAAVLAHCTNPVVCIEPSDLFFPYLEENIRLLTQNDFNRVKTFKRFVGTGLLSGELVHSAAGTATVKVADSSNEITHISLDELIEQRYDIVLLKVDTDGFDFDVIQSADRICADSEPILFWENEILEDFQHTGFNKLYPWLSDRGYKYIYVFDNFGNLMIEECDFETLKNINAYIYSMKKNGCTRTLYYTDILAATEKYDVVVKKAVTEYKREWIYK
jgi:FkbM family methyltransferase